MYEIPGFVISKLDVDNLPEYGAITYKTLFCEFAIATDDMGTQICYNGRFFGGFHGNIDAAILWLSYNKERTAECKRFFRKVWFKSWKYTLSYRHFRHLYWKVRHYFQPNFYLR